MGISKKLQRFRAELFLNKTNYLFAKGLQSGDIVPFDDNFYQQMSQTYINALPVSMDIKYLRPTLGPGKCYDRSLRMFYCFENALLVRGDLKTLKLNAPKYDPGHGWIEMDGAVYDPTYLMKFNKDLYYKMFGVNNVAKCTLAEYCQEPNCKAYYDEIKNTTLADYQPGGRKRWELLTTVPLVKGIAELSNNPAFQKELDAYLTSINYDEEQVFNLVTNKINELVTNKINERSLDKQR